MHRRMLHLCVVLQLAIVGCRNRTDDPSNLTAPVPDATASRTAGDKDQADPLIRASHVPEPAPSRPGQSGMSDSESVLQRLAEFARNVESFRVIHQHQLDDGNAPQRMEIAVERPNRIVMRSLNWHGGPHLVSDGDRLAVQFSAVGKYLEGDAPELLQSLLENPRALALGPSHYVFPEIAFFALHLAVDEPDAVLMRNMVGCDYIGRDVVKGIDADHLRFMGPDFSWDLWIAAEGPPVPIRVVNPAYPENRVDTFSQWELNVNLSDDDFRIPAADGLERQHVTFENPGARLIGQPAPPATFALLDGTPVTIASHRDTDIVLLDFWATWCGPCIAEMPVLAEVAAEYQDRGVVLYAVTDEAEESVREFLGKREFNVTVAIEPTGQVAAAYGAAAIPHLVVIDKQGVVRAIHSGFSATLGDRLRQELNEIINGRSERDGDTAQEPSLPELIRKMEECEQTVFSLRHQGAGDISLSRRLDSSRARPQPPSGRPKASKPDGVCSACAPDLEKQRNGSGR